MQGLRDSVEPLLSGRPSSDRKSALYSSLILYVFRGCRQDDVRNTISNHNLDFDFLTWRKDIHQNGTLMKNCKVWAYNSFVKEKALPASSFGINTKDRNALIDCLNTRAVAVHLRSLVEYGAEPLDLDVLDERLTESLYSRDVTSYLKHLVRQKLGFIYRSQGIPASDFVDELRVGALFTLLRSYPRYEDVGHMKAICKAQAHNQAINIIHSNVAVSRQRLQENPDGTYSSLMVPLAEFGADQVISSEGETVSTSYLVTGLDGVAQSRWEQSFALREIMRSTRLTDKQRLFLNLMTGVPNKEFSEEIGMDNSEAVDSMLYSAYFKRVCKFVRVKEDRARSFLSSLRVAL